MDAMSASRLPLEVGLRLTLGMGFGMDLEVGSRMRDDAVSDEDDER